MHINDVPGNFYVIHPNVFRFLPGRLAPKVSKVRTENPVSIMNILHGDRAIGNKLFTHQSFEFPLSGVPNHPLKSSSFFGLLDLVPCITFEISPNRSDHHTLLGDILILFLILFLFFGYVSCHQHVLDNVHFCGHVNIVKPALAWLELHYPILGMHLEYSVPVPAVVCDSVLLRHRLQG